MTEYCLTDQLPRSTAVVRQRVKLAELAAFLAQSISDVLIAIEELGATPAGEPFAYYHAVPDGVVDVEVGFPVSAPIEPIRNVIPAQLPGGRVMTAVHIGAYDHIASSYAAMRAWAIANGLRPTDDMWEVYLTDPERDPNPEHRRIALFLKVTGIGAGSQP